MPKPTGDYTIGYRRPPKASQFRPGQSGNPHGRPREVIDHDQVVEDELQRKVRVKENGKWITITVHRAIVRRTCLCAMQGKYSFAERLLRSAKSLSLERPTAGIEEEDLVRYLENSQDELGDDEE